MCILIASQCSPSFSIIDENPIVHRNKCGTALHRQRQRGSDVLAHAMAGVLPFLADVTLYVLTGKHELLGGGQGAQRCVTLVF